MNELINGIICINKPQEHTSFDVTAIMRRCAGTRKIGHGGTLDPQATGVLPVFIGRAAKAVDLLPVDTKSYRAGFKLGVASDTEDVWGTIIKTEPCHVSLDELDGVMSSMLGEYMQTPPMYSAVKVGGKKLYELARKGIEVERKARKVRIYEIKPVSFDEETSEGIFEVTCSKGTYIRTLITDIAAKLGTVGIMTSLVRTMSGGFTLDDCHELEMVKALSYEEFSELLIPTDRVFEVYDKVTLDEKQRRLFLNGVVLDTGRMGIAVLPETALRVYDTSGEFLGLAASDEEGGLKIKFLNVLR